MRKSLLEPLLSCSFEHPFSGRTQIAAGSRTVLGIGPGEQNFLCLMTLKFMRF